MRPGLDAQQGWWAGLLGGPAGCGWGCGCGVGGVGGGWGVGGAGGGGGRACCCWGPTLCRPAGRTRPNHEHSVGSSGAMLLANPPCRCAPPAQGVCHRDIKLENTLLDGRTLPRVQLCDFGCALTVQLYSAAATCPPRRQAKRSQPESKPPASVSHCEWEHQPFLREYQPNQSPNRLTYPLLPPSLPCGLTAGTASPTRILCQRPRWARPPTWRRKCCPRVR